MHKDLFRVEIRVGDFFVYSALAGRSACLKIGVVTRLEEREASYYTAHEKKKTIRAVTAEKNWGKENWDLQKNGKEVTLGELDRVVVVDSLLVPEEVRKLLNSCFSDV